MENDAQLEQGRFTFNDIHRYLRDGCYPDGYTKPDKLALRKRAKFFCTRGADLIYVGGSSSKFLSSTYVYVSAFVGTFLSLRPFYTIERDAQVSERLAVEDLHQRKRIIANVHDSSHLGVNRTLDMITAKYYWPGLTQDVKEYVSGLVNVVCIRCNTSTIYRCCCALIKPFMSGLPDRLG